MQTAETTLQMANCTMFVNFATPVGDIPLNDILSDIRNGKYKSLISNIHNEYEAGNDIKANNLKKALPAFTPSATFKGGRNVNSLSEYSGFIHLDFDKLPNESIQAIFDLITKIPTTYCCFRSPSGCGLKVFVPVDSDAKLHPIAYKQVQTHYESLLSIKADPACKDITRLCFVSDDSDAYFNPICDTFEVHTTDTIECLDLETVHLPNYQTIFSQCLGLTEKISTYEAGNRNNFIFLLASNCNRYGIPLDEAHTMIQEKYDLTSNEISKSVQSAYVNHVADFAKFAKIAKPDNTITTEPTLDYLKETPTINDSLIPILPKLIFEGARAFSDNRERDVFLTGALGILSGCLPNVTGVYAQQTVYPNLFCFIIAPAASGKGALKFSKMLADKEHANMLKESRETLDIYETELNDYRNQLRFKKKGDELIPQPVKPPLKVLFIPANSSYAKILAHLEDNSGSGIICETEADTMGNVLKQEWGSYSDMLRKSFHHERLSSSKKTNNEYIEVDEPKLSVALSGTPSQVTSLISSSEDGLFSRFIFYAFKVDPQWRDVSPKASNFNLTNHFHSLSNTVVDLIKFLSNNPTIVELSDNQWQKLNETCDSWLKQIIIFNGEDSGSIVKRLGLILYRIAMIFTALRKFETYSTDVKVVCSDNDFYVATQLAQLYLDHSIFMYHNLPNQSKLGVFKGTSNKQRFFDELPKQFKRADAIELGKKYELKERTVDGFLKSLLGKYLTQEVYGTYSKV